MEVADSDQSADPRDLRINQLEHALGSRIVIEQAKGIIFERFGLTMSESFELLRQVARAERMKINDLARQLLETRATPTKIIEALARTNHVQAEEFTEQAVAAEQLFAAINDELAAGPGDGGETMFICECSNPLCREPLAISADALGRIHANPGMYVLKAGHQLDDIEEVLVETDELAIVRKFAEETIA